MNKVTGYLEWDSFLKFIEYTKEHYPMVCCYAMVATRLGLRMSDMMNIRWRDLEKDMIVIKEEKTGKERKIPVHPDVRTLLSLQPKTANPNHFIFVNKHGTQLSRVYINKIIKKAFEESGITTDGNVSSHMFRKTLGRRILTQSDNQEFGLILLSEVFQHSSTAITRKYLGLRQEEIKNAYLNT